MLWEGFEAAASTKMWEGELGQIAAVGGIGYQESGHLDTPWLAPHLKWNCTVAFLHFCLPLEVDSRYSFINRRAGG